MLNIDFDATIRWTISDADGLDRHGIATTSTEVDGTIRVALDDLEPGHSYQYGFALGDARVSGGFRTIPLVGPVTFGVVCCAKFNAGFFSAYRHLALRDDLDFVLHLGDYIYEAANVPPRSQTPGADIGRDMNPLWECRTLNDYRARYAQYRLDPDLQLLHSRHAVIATLDDHEIADNAWIGGADEHVDNRDGPWHVRLSAALQAWREWLPVSEKVYAGAPIWRRVSLGAVGELLLLETRSARDRESLPPTQLGLEQAAWLFEAIVSGSDWLVLGVPSMMTGIWSDSLSEVAASALQTLKLIDPETRGPFHDLWDAFDDERTRVFQALAASNRPSLILAGDVHIGAEARPSETSPTLQEWVTTSVTSQNLDDKLARTARAASIPAQMAFMRSQPAVHWCDFDSHGYVVVHASEANLIGEWWALDEVRSPSSGIQLVHRSVTCR